MLNKNDEKIKFNLLLLKEIIQKLKSCIRVRFNFSEHVHDYLDDYFKMIVGFKRSCSPPSRGQTTLQVVENKFYRRQNRQNI